jgi:catalase
MRSADNNWDFWTLLPEALHQVTIVMSDRGIPRSFRTCTALAATPSASSTPRNERFWVKFHFRCQQGIENLTDAEAAAVVGRDRESHQRDLFDAIERRLPALDAVHPGDDRRLRPRRAVQPVRPHQGLAARELPLIEVGVLELNRNPDNYLRRVEQAAFSPANVVPGISFSPDKMLQARLFSYGDAQRYRLGVNFNHIPVNAPKCPFHSYHRDGAMRTDGNLAAARRTSRTAVANGSSPSSPNRRWRSKARPRTGITASTTDYYSQPGNLFRLLTAEKKQLLFENTARAIHGVSKPVQERHIFNCTQADPAYGAGVAAAIAALEAK